MRCGNEAVNNAQSNDAQQVVHVQHRDARGIALCKLRIQLSDLLLTMNTYHVLFKVLATNLFGQGNIEARQGHTLPPPFGKQFYQGNF